MAKPRCPGCRKRDARLAALERRVADLEARRGRHAGNSSVPPSANPPAAPPVVKVPSGRQPGARPGHAPCPRARMPAERVQHVVHHRPASCRGGGHALPAEPGPHDPKPTWHQVAELPEITAVVTEHQGHTRTCPRGGVQTHAALPADVRAHVLGPHLTAVTAYLSGARHDSQRGVEEVIETVFGVPVALGTVSAAEQEASAALASAHTEVAAHVQAAPSKQVEETGWKQSGRLCWLWTAVTAGATYFVLHARRGLAGLTALPGEIVTGLLLTDRRGAYNRLGIYQRPLCWAPLKREFQGLVDRGGPGKALGGEPLTFTADVFHWWYRVRDGTLSRASLRTYIDEQRPWRRDLLARGTVCGCVKAAALCAGLLEWEPALWAFVRVEGVEPTNNAAERALRPAVLWRKRSQGSRSDAGCRFVERMLTAVQTLRAQQRNVLAYLHEAVIAHRAGLPAPKLLPIG